MINFLAFFCTHVYIYTVLSLDSADKFNSQILNFREEFRGSRIGRNSNKFRTGIPSLKDTQKLFHTFSCLNNLIKSFWLSIAIKNTNLNLKKTLPQKQDFPFILRQIMSKIFGHKLGAKVSFQPTLYPILLQLKIKKKREVSPFVKKINNL